MPEYKTTSIGCAAVKQGCFNSGHTKSLHGRSDTNDRRRPPVTEVKQITNRQNGELEAAHSRTANLPQLTPAKKDTANFNSLQYPFNYA